MRLYVLVSENPLYPGYALPTGVYTSAAQARSAAKAFDKAHSRRSGLDWYVRSYTLDAAGTFAGVEE